MTGLLGMFKKVYSLAAQSFRMRKKWGFQQGFVCSWQAFGQLGRAVENLAVRSAPFLVRSRQCVSARVEIRVFLCL